MNDPLHPTTEPTNAPIETAIGTLANTMRLYVESQMRFAELFEVDREEAVNNLDRAFEAKLEAFHTLYDVSEAIFPYFRHGDTALIIAVRNAIHHRRHPLFRSLYARLFLEAPRPLRGAAFLLASYPTLHGAPILMNHFIKLDDIYARLDPKRASPYLETIGNPGRATRRFALIERQLALPRIQLHGASQGFPADQIYLDLLPIFTSAVSRVFKAMNSAGVAFKGFDAETYLVPFTTEINVDLENPVFSSSAVSLLQLGR